MGALRFNGGSPRCVTSKLETDLSPSWFLSLLSFPRQPHAARARMLLSRQRLAREGRIWVSAGGMTSHEPARKIR